MGSSRMNSSLNSSIRHARIRLCQLARSPWSLLIFIATGLASLIWWPDLPNPGAAAHGGLERLGGFQSFFWVLYWAALPGKLIGGRAATEGRWGSLRTPLPTLPIGVRSRVLTEAILAMCILVVIRTPGLLIGDWLRLHSDFRSGYPWPTSYPAYFWYRTLVGTLITFPVLLAWVCPVGRIEVVFRRPVIVVTLLWIAMEFGLLRSPLGCAIACAGLTGLLLATIDRGWTIIWRRSSPAALPCSHWRPARDPNVQFHRDLFLRPIPLVVVILCIELPAILIDRYLFRGRGDGGPGVMFFGSLLVVFGLYSYLPLRPLGQSVGSFFGQRPDGTLMRACATLPIRRSTVVRGIYAYSLLSGLVVWGVGIGLAILSSWMHSGHLQRDGGGGAGHAWPWLLLAIPLCTASAVTAGVMGARARGVVSTVATIGVLTALLIHSSGGVPTTTTAVVVAGLTVVGGFPARSVLLGT